MQTENINLIKKTGTIVTIFLLIFNMTFGQNRENVPYELSKIDGFEMIGDSTLRFRNKLLFDSIKGLLMNENFQQDAEFKTVKFKALKSNQMLIANAKPDGYWSDYFTIEYASKDEREKYFILNDSIFSCYRYIELGISKQQLDSFLMKIPGCVLKGENGVIVYKYYWFDYFSLDYEAFGIPFFVGSFIFNNNKLIKFGFGYFKAEIDLDFFSLKYEIVSGKEFNYTDEQRKLYGK